MSLIRVETSYLIYRIAVITARYNATAPFTVATGMTFRRGR